jgi:proteasome assembly chaperone (PAC2) family protein
MTDRNLSKDPLRDPWLVAVWPGMGSVAAMAGTYLAETLGSDPAGSIPGRDFFNITHVDVQGGIARSGAFPRNLFFVWRDPTGRRDLLIFLGEAQPSRRGYDLCHRILDVAEQHGVKRVVTFAAMGTPLHPQTDPRVFGAVTAPEHLKELRGAGAQSLPEGRVGGLNGALLAVAAERDMDAMCLLGEMPFYAAGIINPKSSLAVLQTFSRLSGIELDLARLESITKQAEDQLLQLMEQLREQAGQLEDQLDEGLGDPEEAERDGEPEENHAVLEVDDQRHIDELFDAVSHDRSRAGELKQELDRLGVFKDYEDRFLDLFRTR